MEVIVVNNFESIVVERVVIYYANWMVHVIIGFNIASLRLLERVAYVEHVLYFEEVPSLHRRAIFHRPVHIPIYLVVNQTALS